MTKAKRSLLMSVLLMHAVTASAGEVLEDTGAWTQVTAEGSLKVINPALQDMRLWVEGQSRFDGDWTHWYQGMVRTALGYSVSDRATIWGGYNWLPTQNIHKPNISEQDAWAAFRYVLPTDLGPVTFRTMMETSFQRGDQVRERARQSIRWQHPLVFEPRLSLVAWDEAFFRLNTTSWGGQAGFDQNRSFAGVSWVFSSHVRTELGYLNQYVDDAKHINASMRHLAMASVFISF